MSKFRIVAGQTWEDNDYRRPQRYIEVVSVPRSGRNAGRVRCRDNYSGREFFAAAKRFNGTTRGYNFVG